MSEQMKKDVKELVEILKSHGRAACCRRMQAISKERGLLGYEEVVLNGVVREVAMSMGVIIK